MATLSAPDPSRRIAGLKQAIRRIETLREPPSPRGRGRGRRVDDPLLGPAGEAALVDFGLPALDAVFPGGGLSAGSHQLTAPPGQEGTAAAVALTLIGRRLRSRPGQALLITTEAVAAEEGCLSAEGLRAMGVDLDRTALLYARNGREAVQAADEALKSGAVAALLLDAGPGARIDLSLTRRFNLAAQRGQALAFLAGGALEATSAALTRWRVSSGPSARRRISAARPGLGPPAFSLALTRNRLGGLGRWDLEWDCDACIFRPLRPTLPLSVAPLDGGRTAAASPGRRGPDWAAGPGRQAG